MVGEYGQKIILLEKELLLRPHCHCLYLIKIETNKALTTTQVAPVLSNMKYIWHALFPSIFLYDTKQKNVRLST